MENIRMAQQIINDASSVVGIRKVEEKENKNIQISLIETPGQPAQHQNLEQQISGPGLKEQQHMRPEQHKVLYLSCVFIFIAFYTILIFYCLKRRNMGSKKTEKAKKQQSCVQERVNQKSKQSGNSSQNNSTTHSLNEENSLSTDEDQPFLEKPTKPYIISSINRTKTHPSSQNPQINFPKMQSNQDGIFVYGMKRSQGKEVHVGVSIGYMKNSIVNMFAATKQVELAEHGSNIPVRQAISV